ncbi:GerAB/ArcD/ProY family transporter [Desulfitobacterium metallireducens]|uniref:Spore germination protein n=1 Tax=Desulfitobacterium metallireducens DSM 15288 TaxID=871968 RepID=W0E4Z2_9FIRM|nr:endospore germination permease [Desulfitobacterium metallireducens]AHF05817.1 spore germination protein [Desulfitobacterium metallireducens DSM 15288]
MLEKGRITYKQLILLIFLSRIVTSISFLPGLNEPPANQDIWLSDLLFFPIQLFLASPIYLLWKRFPDQTIIQYSQTIAGKVGKLVGLLIIWYFLHYTAITLAQYSFFLTSAVMPETPALFFMLSLILVCAYAARKGLEVIGRLSELFAPLIMISLILFLSLEVKDMNFKILTPLLEKGIFPVFHGSLIAASKTLEVLGLAMLLPYLNNRQKVKPIFILSFALISLYLVLLTLPVVTMLGLELAKSSSFPCYSVIRLINVGDFLNRLESIHMAICSLGAFIKISFQYYLTVLGLSQLLELREYKPLVLPIGALLIPLSLLIGPNLVELQLFSSYKIFMGYSYFFILLIPSLLLLTAIIRRKGVRSK